MAAGFLAAAFLAAVGLLGGAFLACFLAAGFLVTVFLAAGFLLAFLENLVAFLAASFSDSVAFFAAGFLTALAFSASLKEPEAPLPLTCSEHQTQPFVQAKYLRSPLQMEVPSQREFNQIYLLRQTFGKNQSEKRRRHRTWSKKLNSVPPTNNE